MSSPNNYYIYKYTCNCTIFIVAVAVSLDIRELAYSNASGGKPVDSDHATEQLYVV